VITTLFDEVAISGDTIPEIGEELAGEMLILLTVTRWEMLIPGRNLA
jgi:hypothetical protein